MGEGGRLRHGKSKHRLPIWVDRNSKRTCGRSNNDPNTCSPASFTFDEQTFSRVCGRVKAYAYGGVDGFENFLTNRNVDNSYVSGVSLTIDPTPMTQTITHVWTFVAGLDENGRTNTANEVPDQCPCEHYKHTSTSVCGEQLFL